MSDPKPKPVSWERVPIDLGSCLDRLPVPGGWLYRLTAHPSCQPVSLVFVPTPSPKKK